MAEFEQVDSCRTIPGSRFSTEAKCSVMVDEPPPAYDSVACIKGCQTTKLDDNLPTYSEASGQCNFVSDGPPSYHSLFRETVIRAVNPFAEDTGCEGATVNPIATIHRALPFQPVSILITGVLAICICCIAFVLPLCMIAIGVANFHNCPGQPRIPIYLIVLGFFQMLECCGRLGYKLFASHGHSHRNSWRERYRRKDPIVYFIVVWFVIGSMWVYQVNPDAEIPGKSVASAVTSISDNSSAVFGQSVALFPTVVPIILSSGSPENLPSSSKVRFCDKGLYRFAFWMSTSYYIAVALFCSLVLVDVLLRILSRCFRRGGS